MLLLARGSPRSPASWLLHAVTGAAHDETHRGGPLSRRYPWAVCRDAKLQAEIGRLRLALVRSQDREDHPDVIQTHWEAHQRAVAAGNASRSPLQRSQPQPIFAVVWDGRYNAEGLVFPDEAGADAKFAELKGGAVAARIYAANGQVVQSYGRPGKRAWMKCAQWARLNLNQPQPQVLIAPVCCLIVLVFSLF